MDGPSISKLVSTNLIKNYSLSTSKISLRSSLLLSFISLPLCVYSVSASVLTPTTFVRLLHLCCYLLPQLCFYSISALFITISTFVCLLCLCSCPSPLYLFTFAPYLLLSLLPLPLHIYSISAPVFTPSTFVRLLHLWSCLYSLYLCTFALSLLQFFLPEPLTFAPYILLSFLFLSLYNFSICDEIKVLFVNFFGRRNFFHALQ